MPKFDNIIYINDIKYPVIFTHILMCQEKGILM